MTAPALRSGNEGPLNTRAAAPDLDAADRDVLNGARASGLPLRPAVHNAAERDRSADSGRARQPMFRPRPSQPCSFCGRWSAAWRRRRLGRIHGTEGFPEAICLSKNVSWVQRPRLWGQARQVGWAAGGADRRDAWRRAGSRSIDARARGLGGTERREGGATWCEPSSGLSSKSVAQPNGPTAAASRISCVEPKRPMYN